MGLLDNSVNDYDFSMRVRSCLKSADIRTLRELVVRSEAELLQGRHCGRLALKEIKDVLAVMGLRLGMRDDDDFLNSFP
jgi:DNA-directed RNA polymerase subunit alpha